MLINRLGRVLEDFVKKEVESQIKETEENKDSWINFYEEIEYKLEDEIKEARKVLKEFKELNFSVNRIEVEGYLRGLITALERVKNTKKYYDKN